MRPGWLLPIAAREHRHAIRLRCFRREHPDVTVESGEFGTVRAIVPLPDGEQICVRHSLGELLDQLDKVLPPNPGEG